MTWSVACPEDASPGLRALVDSWPVASPEQADIVLWPARRRGSMPVGAVLNVVDLRGVEPGTETGLAGAGLLLVGSAAEFGAWAVRARGVPIGVVPTAVEPAAAASGRFEALHILAGPDETEAAERAASWAAARGMPCGVADGALDAVARIGPAPPIGPGAVVLDLRTGAARIDAPPGLLGLLAAGAPVLFREDTPLRAALEGAGAGWRSVSVEAGLARVAGLGEAAFRRASAASLAFVAARFGAAGARAAFQRAVDGALEQVGALASAWAASGPGGHVLVVSDEGPNLRHVRVHLPFDALVRRGAIAGYSVLHRGDFVFGTAPVTPETRFSAIWVQRSVDPLVQLLLRVLDRPFVYDLDDNLLISPSYRRAFDAEAIETAAGLVRQSAVLSCATSRLADAMPGGKAIVTPNLAAGAPVRVMGRARTVVWASSDAPALAGSRVEIERAVRDFCRAHALPVVCIGAPPPATFAASGIVVEAVGLLPYPAYLERLRAAAPGLLIGPLETGADPATQRFVDAKSDIKIIEARLAGLQGVFSRAAPYAESDLQPGILCDNDYAGWIDGLERARLACEHPGEPSPWPGRRDVDGAGPMPWAEALRRAPAEVSAREVTAALRFVRQQAETLLGAPALFDEADYLRRHVDVAEAVATGVVASGYRHFVQSGFREGRAARRVGTPEGEASFWWARLLHELSGLEESVAAQDRAVAVLGHRVAVRRLLPDPPPADAAASDGTAEAGWFRWGHGEPRPLPCPVCAASGPHEAVGRAEARVLLRCDRCATCFYEDRSEHAYEIELAAGLMLQFALEQNASIHHQTRLLFGRQGAGSVLDVGCGFGFAVDMAARVLRWRAVGVDPSSAAAAGSAQLGADIRQAYLNDETVAGPPFDRVIASEVIEHVADPAAMLALLRRRLAPGGVLAVTTPNAAAIARDADQGRLLGILAPGVHLTLFNERSLAMALRDAGFAHVAVEATADTLVAEASDWPLPASAAAEHDDAYRAYLRDLMARAAPASPLWNGAAGRLLALLTPTAPPEELARLFAEIAAAWHPLGIDLAAPHLPAPLTEAEIGTIGATALGRQRPFNLAGVLLCRALMEQRAQGRPEAVLAFAEPAHRVAVETRRVLQAENLVDLDLKRTAWRARLLMAECVASLAPGLEGALVAGVTAGSPGELADWVDPPPDATVGVAAEFFARAVAADRFDEARRVEASLDDVDRIVAALDGKPALLLRTLFMRGVHRLMAHCDPAGALSAFERLAREARRLDAADYAAIAERHMALASARLTAP